MVGEEPRNAARGVRKISPKTQMRSPVNRAEKKPVAAMLEAESVLRRPSSREMKLPLPWPKKKPTAWIMVIMENTTPTAPVAALLFSIPTKKVSAIL